MAQLQTKKKIKTKAK